MGEFSKGNEYWFDWLFQWSRNFFENIHYHLGVYYNFYGISKKFKNLNTVFLMNTIICSIFLLITIFNSNNQYFSFIFKTNFILLRSSFSILIFGLIKNYKIIFSWMFALFANLIIFLLLCICSFVVRHF